MVCMLNLPLCRDLAKAGGQAGGEAHDRVYRKISCYTTVLMTPKADWSPIVIGAVELRRRRSEVDGTRTDRRTGWETGRSGATYR